MQVFLPFVMLMYALTGVQDETLGGYASLYIPHSTVQIAARWDVIEAERGKYDWTALDAAVMRMPGNVQIIIGAKTSPEWARKYPAPCSQPKAEYYLDYAEFVRNIAMRYPGLYGVEIWNEPDAPPWVFDETHWLYGCWDSGIAYRDMLAVVYPRVRDYTKVIAGGFATASEFSREALSWGDADVVSFHAYTNQGVDNWNRIGEYAAGFRKQTDKPLLVTETALLSYVCDEAADRAKAEYMQHVYDNARNWGIEGWIWYPIGGNDWRCSDLYPGAAYDFMAKEFAREE